MGDPGGHCQRRRQRQPNQPGLPDGMDLLPGWHGLTGWMRSLAVWRGIVDGMDLCLPDISAWSAEGRGHEAVLAWVFSPFGIRRLRAWITDRTHRIEGNKAECTAYSGHKVFVFIRFRRSFVSSRSPPPKKAILGWIRLDARWMQSMQVLLHANGFGSRENQEG